MNAQEKAVKELKNVLEPQQLTQFLSVENRMQNKMRGAKEHRGKNPRDCNGHRGKGHGKGKPCDNPRGNRTIQTPPASN